MIRWPLARFSLQRECLEDKQQLQGIPSSPPSHYAHCSIMWPTELYNVSPKPKLASERLCYTRLFGQVAGETTESKYISPIERRRINKGEREKQLQMPPFFPTSTTYPPTTKMGRKQLIAQTSLEPGQPGFCWNPTLPPKAKGLAA